MRKLIILITVFCFFYSPLSAQRKYQDPFKFEFKKISEGIYVAYRPDPLKIMVECNSTIIINESDVVVFDATGTPKGARQIVDKIKELTDNPVRYLINSHGHGDHTFGNQVFVEAFPGCEIIAHEETRDYMSAPRGSKGPNRKIAYVYEYQTEEGMKKKREYIEGEIKRVKDIGKPGYEKVLEILNEYYEKDLELRRKQYMQVNVTPPTLIFENGMSLFRGRRELQILYLGKGDTPGDVWLYLPNEKILCSPDAVVNPIPFGFSRHQLEWPETLKKALQIDFDILVPGHGEIQYDKIYLTQVIELLDSIHGQVKDAVSRGLSLEETHDFVNVDRLKNKFTNNDPVKEYYFESYTRNAVVENTYEQLTQSK